MREHIGINADSFTINGDIAVLEKFLARFLEAGFSFAEIPIHGMDCLLNGSLCRSRVAATRKALSAYPLGYTVHSPDHLNLADETDPETHARALRSTIDFASEIGARLVVYHGSARAGGRADAASIAMAEMPISPPRHQLSCAPSGPTRSTGWERWPTTPPRAASPWQSRTFSDSPRARSAYRIDPRQLAAVVAAVDSPALGICFDFGHAFISAGEVGFTMEEALRAVKPRLAHVHIHDNFGKPSIPNARPIDMMFRGAGDLHMPPGWGAIPYESLFPIFAGDFRGVFTLELQPRFADKYGEALEWVRHRIASAKGAP